VRAASVPSFHACCVVRSENSHCFSLVLVRSATQFWQKVFGAAETTLLSTAAPGVRRPTLDCSAIIVSRTCEALDSGPVATVN
jgi:hypothetical protein